jgi:hypothetical protein
MLAMQDFLHHADNQQERRSRPLRSARNDIIRMCARVDWRCREASRFRNLPVIAASHKDVRQGGEVHTRRPQAGEVPPPCAGFCSLPPPL